MKQGFWLWNRVGRLSGLRVTYPNDMAPKAEKRGHWGWPVLLMATVMLASGQGAVASPGWNFEDKMAHLAVFGLLGVLWARTLPPRRWWLGAVYASLFGAFDEVRQSFTPGRFMELADWVADTVGAVVAVGLYVRWGFFRNLLEKKLGGRGARSVAKSTSAASE